MLVLRGHLYVQQLAASDWLRCVLHNQIASCCANSLLLSCLRFVCSVICGSSGYLAVPFMHGQELAMLSG